jgi:hypothetical protein
VSANNLTAISVVSLLFFKGSFLLALLTTVISEPLKRPRSCFYCITSVNFGRIKASFLS